MELKDLVVTPLVIMFILVGAYFGRPVLTNNLTRPYYYPALFFSVFCAILVGVLYQFYYNGGDTFFYHTQGSVVIYEALLNDPIEGIKLWFSDLDPQDHPYRYVSQIPYFGDQSSYMVIRIATLFDLFTFGTYSATACMFAVISFLSAWLVFRLLADEYPSVVPGLALGLLFIPSVVFWSSGILKDTLTNSSLLMFFYSFYYLFIKREKRLLNILILLLSGYLLFIIKIYILMCFLPAAGLYVTLHYSGRIRNLVLRWLVFPCVIILSVAIMYLLLDEISKSNERYALTNLSRTAQITAYDIAFWTGKEAGSRYVLGELDGTFASMLRLAPQAVNVSLFRPYLWEVNNVLMLLSAIESIFVLGFTFLTIFRLRTLKLSRVFTPLVIFFLMFAIVFAFAVGISTYNFGTLSRYKIPMIPFYIAALVIINNNITVLKKNRKVEGD